MPPPATRSLSFAERAVYVEPAETLVLADVHLGRGAASAVDAPIDAADEPVERVASLVDRFDPRTVVVAGDLLHSFSWVPTGVRETVSALRLTLDRADVSLVCTPGNHDTMLADVFDGETADACRLDDGETVVCHGHERPTDVHPGGATAGVSTAVAEGTQADGGRSTDDGGPVTVDDGSADGGGKSDAPSLYVIGHDHPALSVDGRKHPCFLFVPDAAVASDVLVLPAFSRLARGTTINTRRGRDFQSPLVTDVEGAFPAVRDEDGGETLWFPPLGECRSVL